MTLTFSPRVRSFCHDRGYSHSAQLVNNKLISSGHVFPTKSCESVCGEPTARETVIVWPNLSIQRPQRALVHEPLAGWPCRNKFYGGSKLNVTHIWYRVRLETTVIS